MIDSWSTYKNWVSELIKNKHTYFFRGQQDISWKLETTFQRYASKNNISWDSYFKKILPDVNYSAASYGFQINDFSNENEVGGFLAKLQHHGFPTPLLDWTTSPYVAAYFALKDIDPHTANAEQNVKIYMFDFQLWTSSYLQPSFLNPSQQFLREFRPSVVNNKRLVSQMAVTTVTNVPDVEYYLNYIASVSNKPYLFYALLPVKERRIIMNELDLMGINSSTMFPDFDGMCLSLKEKHFNNIDPIEHIKPMLLPPIPPPPTIK